MESMPVLGFFSASFVLTLRGLKIAEPAQS